MFQLIFVQPIYNCFIFILGLVPGGDVGIAIIILTILVRVALYPLFTSSIRTQMAMQAVQPEIAEINEKYKDNAVERGRRTTELFSRHRIKISSIFGAAAIQIVLFFALSYAFFKLELPHIRTDLLYPFVHAPVVVNEKFLGVMDLVATHNLILTALVVILQYFVMRLSLARTTPSSTAHLSKEQITSQTLQRNMTQYLLPVLMAFFVYPVPAAVGLYFLAGNVISLLQEWLIRRKPL